MGVIPICKSRSFATEGCFPVMGVIQSSSHIIGNNQSCFPVMGVIPTIMQRGRSISWLFPPLWGLFSTIVSLI